jgi:hypothetical protein
MNESQTEFQTALATARDALEQFNAEPLVASKRGGPRLSPWWRVWVQASEVAQRCHRQLDRDMPEPSIQDEIDRLGFALPTASGLEGHGARWPWLDISYSDSPRAARACLGSR